MLFGAVALLVAASVGVGVYLAIPAKQWRPYDPQASHFTYVCEECRVVFDCPRPLKRIVKCPSCPDGKAYPAWRCNNKRYHAARGEHPYVFPYVVSKKVFPWVCDNESKVRLSRATVHERTDAFFALRNMILDEYPKCPKCGWRPGHGYSESPFTRHWGVVQHFAVDPPVFDCESLDGPDAYPGPSPAEIVEYWMSHGRLPAGIPGVSQGVVDEGVAAQEE
jgi:hypothetical protein